MRKFFKEYFSFARRELNGIIILSIILLLLMFLPHLISLFQQDEKYDLRTFIAEVHSFKNGVEQSRSRIKDSMPPERNLKKINQLYSFDPNKLSAVDWERLGLNKFQARIIIKYRNSIGKFSFKEDISKIYSLSSEDYKRLEPFIQLPSRSSISVYSKQEIRKIININQADSLTLLSLKGIGPVLASRIIKYRNKLNGYISKEQLLEVYGIDKEKWTSFISQIIVDSLFIKKINLNTCTFEELRRHPYFGYQGAKAIINYRNLHGLFSKPDDLKKIMLITPEMYLKMKPYIITPSK